MVAINVPVAGLPPTYGAKMVEWLSAAGSALSGLGNFGRALGIGGGGGPDVGAQQQFSMQQLQMQQAFAREMAQNSIGWRVDDAKRSGISPLVALGAPTFSPPAQSLQGVDYSRGSSGFDPSALARSGQSFVDMAKALTPVDKSNILYQQTMAQQQIKSNDLDLLIKAAQLRKLNEATMRPSMPVGGPAGTAGAISSSVGTYEPKPPEVLNASPSSPSASAGPAGPSQTWFVSGNGLISEPPKNSKAEDEFLSPLMSEWYWRNRVVPNFYENNARPPLEVVQRHFPGATGAYWSTSDWKWKPSYLPGGRRPGWFESNERRIK